MHEEIHGEHGDDRNDREGVVIGGRLHAVIERRHVESELAARVAVVGGEQDVDRLGEGPARDREVDGAHLEHEAAEQVAERGRDDDARWHAEPHGRLIMVDEKPGRIGAECGEGLLGQGELAGEAGQEVPARREDRVIEADREHMERETAGDLRQCGKAKDGNRRYHRDALPVRRASASASSPKQAFVDQLAHALFPEFGGRPLGLDAAQVDHVDIVRMRMAPSMFWLTRRMAVPIERRTASRSS